MTGNEYQKQAARTMRTDLSVSDTLLHAFSGMANEHNELLGLHQKSFQGHEFDREHAKKEAGDLLWFLSEYCTIMDFTLDDVMQTNIDKLKKRFPDGFDPEKSLHREKGDL